MKIGFLFKSYEKNMTGINALAYNSVKELLNKYPEHEYFSIAENYLNIQLKNIRYNSITLNNVAALHVIGAVEKIDVIHSFYNPISSDMPVKKKILTINDIAPLTHPEWFYESTKLFFQNQIYSSACSADAIVAISEYTKKEIVDYYHIDKNKIFVVYPGFNPSIDLNTFDNKILEKYHLCNVNYVLSVCTLEPRKNLRGIIQAFINYKQKSKSEIKLVLCGQIGWDDTFFDFINGIHAYKQDIIMLGYVSNKDLGLLYKYAMAFVYTSFYEGFGLPILEALTAGKAVITSDTTSMPEVGGDAVCYCNPYDVDSIMHALEKVIEDNEYRSQLEKKSVIQAKKFSYSITAEKLIDLYQK